MARPAARVLTLFFSSCSRAASGRWPNSPAGSAWTAGPFGYVDHLLDLDVPVESVRDATAGTGSPPGTACLRVHAERRGGAGRAARPDGGAAGRADDGDGHGGGRDGRGQIGGSCRSGSHAGSTPCWGHSPSPPRPASSPASPGERGPALRRRRGAPSPAGLDHVHRRRPLAQRTHPAPVRAGRSHFRPVVRHGRGSGDRRGPDLPARPHRRHPDPARLVQAARRARPGPARALRARPGSVPASGDPADPGDGRADPGPASGQRRQYRERPRPTRIGRPRAGSAWI